MEDDEPEINYDEEEVYSDPEAENDNNKGDKYEIVPLETLDKEREKKIE